MLSNVYARVRNWSLVLANAVGLMLVVCCVLLLVADMERKPANDSMILLADNLAIVTAALSGVLAVLLLARPAEATPTFKQSTIPTLAGIAAGLLTAGTLLTILHNFYSELTPHDIALGVALCIGIGFTVNTLLAPFAERHARPAPHVPLWTLLAGVIIFTGLGIFLRWQFAGSTVLTWVIAPANLFVLPGICLGMLLLPNQTRWTERLILAPPLAIAALLVTLSWLLLFGIPASLGVLVMVGSLISLTALAIQFVVDKRQQTGKIGEAAHPNDTETGPTPNAKTVPQQDVSTETEPLDSNDKDDDWLNTELERLTSS